MRHTGNFFLSNNTTIQLSREVGSGGEGGVYLVHGRPEVVAKIYHRPPDKEKALKLAAMIQMSANLTDISAWPLDTLHSSPRGPVCGFLMPQVQGHLPVHKLYSPRDRKHNFPSADWGFLVSTACNVAAAIETAHEAGVVIGDINENGVLVGHNTLVRFIDCDSFQLTRNGSTFHCTVGVPLYTAPELIGKNLGRITRTTNHDAFGLAILIFHLLMMGRHPFAGRYSGREDMPIDRAITTFRYAYGRLAHTKNMAPPPNAPPITLVPSSIENLFEAAFSENAANARPSAKVWAGELAALGRSLTRCDKSPIHTYFSGVARCPWCELETNANVVYFVAALGLTSSFLGDSKEAASSFESVLSRIRALPLPLVPQFADPATMHPTGRSVEAGARSTFNPKVVFRIVGLGILLLLFVTYPSAWLLWAIAVIVVWSSTSSAGWSSPLSKEIARRRAEYQRIEGHLQALIEAASAHSGLTELNQLYIRFSEIERSYRGLPAWKTKEEEKIRTTARQRQLENFLDRFPIRSSDISGIGDTRKALLRSFGIETAADVSESTIMGIRGFGPGLTSNLLHWRNQFASRFVFDSSKAITNEDAQQLDLRMRQFRNDLVRQAVDAGNQIERGRNGVLVKIAEIKKAIDQTAALVAQAREDVKVAQELAN